MKAAKRTFAFLGIFVFMILSIGFASASCLDLVEVNIPSNVNHDDGTLNIEFTINQTAFGGCGNQTITEISVNSSLNGVSFGTWSTITGDISGNNFPIVLSDFEISNFSANLIFPQHFSGDISTTVSITSTTNFVETLSTITILDSPSFSLSQGTDLTQEINGTFNLTNSGNADLTLLFTETTNFGVDFSENNVDLSAGQSLTDLIGVFFTTLDNLIFGDNEVKVNVSDSSNGVSTETTFTVEKHFCDSGEVGGNLSIKNVDFENLGDGDDNEWELLDEIEVEVEVENLNNDDEMEDVIVEIGLYDSEGHNVADDLEFLSGGESEEESDEFDIDDDDEETIKFVFRVPADFEEGNYRLGVKAHSDDLGEDSECTDSSDDLNKDFYQEITIERENDREKSIVIEDIEMASQAMCGQTVSGTFTVFNIGDDDEEKVKITMKNTGLGLSEEFEILNDLDSGDEETVSFSFDIPEGIEDKTYLIRFVTYFDYDDGDYDEISEDSFDKYISIIGCETQTEESVLVTAELDSEAEAGEELVITSTITNLGAETATFAIEITGFD